MLEATVAANFESARSGPNYMSRVTRKPVFRVSDQARHKPSCTAKEDDLRLEFGVVGNRGIYYQSSEKKKQLSAHCAADLVRLCFRICKKQVF